MSERFTVLTDCREVLLRSKYRIYAHYISGMKRLQNERIWYQHAPRRNKIEVTLNLWMQLLLLLGRYGSVGFSPRFQQCHEELRQHDPRD